MVSDFVLQNEDPSSITMEEHHQLLIVKNQAALKLVCNTGNVIPTPSAQ